MDKLNKFQDGTRTLLESIPVPEVATAMHDWKQNASNQGILIGGCAVSYHALPRATMDVDVLYQSSNDIPSDVNGFKRTRPGAFRHNDTHVEVETIHPHMINVSPEMAKAVHDDSSVVNGTRVASPSGVVALKLHRQKFNDIGDIVAMHNTGKVDLSKFPLTQAHLDAYNHIISTYS
jgi:hypothetical protein